jgi:hypothetical protein
LLQVFFINHLPQAPENSFATGTAGVVDTGGKFATGVNDTNS